MRGTLGDYHLANSVQQLRTMRVPNFTTNYQQYAVPIFKYKFQNTWQRIHKRLTNPLKKSTEQSNSKFVLNPMTKGLWWQLPIQRQAIFLNFFS